MRRLALALLVAVPLAPSLASAQLDAWAEGADDSDDGATRDFYNRGGSLRWRQLLGDWSDRAGTLHGDMAWASTRVEDTDVGRYVEWDVTDLVNAWLAGSERELGFFLRPVGGGGPIVFASREVADAGQRPQLVVMTSGGEMTLDATADTHLVESTYQSHGESEELRVGSSNHLLVRFDTSGLPDASSATLRVYTTRQFGGGLDVGVFNVVTGVDAPAPELGLAAAYEDDVGIDGHADVVMFEDFEAADWMDHWTSHGGTFDIADGDSAFGFEALNGRALRVLMPEGENTALNTRYDFMEETGSEPDEIYFRYYMRFGSDWNQSVDGGKLPGISGTYGVAGWGGRMSDGSNGWSARGLFRQSVPATNNPLAGRTPIGSYVYHADMPSTFGENFLWNEAWGADGIGGILQPGRWVCLETYVRMNTPTQNDGVIRAWVDGVLSYENTGMRFRDVDTLRIERIWMNIYHGGTDVSPYDQHAFIDHVVIASSYIGPMGGDGPPPPSDAGPADGDAGTVPPGTDAGPLPPGVDGGPGGDPPGDDGGCGCHAAGSPRSAPWALGLVLGLAALLRHGRRR